MDAERYQKIKKIFNQSAEIAVSEREDFLKSACDDSEMRREIEKMLAFADDANDTLDKNAYEIFTNGKHLKIPEKIGDYKILREIGRGGMGAVYEAVRENKDFRRRVALKVIKRGMDTDTVVSRFRVEQKILASLEHSFIARFLDGEMTADGLPFYAMEFVEGEPIDDYCAAKNLSIDERLKLFREVCAAVQYAHQNLVVHRDLKPKNILVTKDGTPKLLDFGIGKILTPDTEEEIGTATQLGMMTPAYASPEQIRGERIGTASDIYSLGVILYELLTGQKPYKFTSKSQIEIEKAILELEPTKPSAIQNSKTKEINRKSQIANRKSLKGDLDTIILKALRKEISERYVSVGQFSEDIRRYLEGVPIMARPGTFSYRAAKFIRRNRVGVLAAGLVFLSLCIGIAAAMWQARRAEQQKILAEKRFSEVRQIANNVVFKYTDAISNLPNSAEVREMLLRDASDYLDRLAQDAGNDTALQRELAAAYTKLGDIRGRPHSASLGDTAGAIESYEKAVPLLENVYRNAPSGEKTQIAAELIALYREIGTTFSRADLNTPNRALYIERTRSVIEEIAREFPENTTFKIESARVKTNEAERLLKSDFERGEQIYREQIFPLLAEIEKTAEGERFAANVYNELAWLYGEQAKLMLEAGGDRERAARIFQSSLEFALREEQIKQLRFGREPGNVRIKRGLAVGLTNAAIALHNLERFDESLERLNEALRIKQELVAFDAKNIQAVFDLGTVFSELGIVYHKKKDFARAIGFYEQALASFDRVIATDAENYEAVYYKIDVLTQTANSFAAMENVEKSLEFFRRAEDLAAKTASTDENHRIQRGRIYLQRARVLMKFAGRNREFSANACRDLKKSSEVIQAIGTPKTAIQIEIIRKESAGCGMPDGV